MPVDAQPLSFLVNGPSDERESPTEQGAPGVRGSRRHCIPLPSLAARCRLGGASSRLLSVSCSPVNRRVAGSSPARGATQSRVGAWVLGRRISLKIAL
jgi:hypothetical protein